MEMLFVSTLFFSLCVMVFSTTSANVAKGNLHESRHTNTGTISLKKHYTAASVNVNTAGKEYPILQDQAFKYFNCVTHEDNFIRVNKEKATLNASTCIPVNSKEFPFDGHKRVFSLADTNVDRKMRMCKDKSCIPVFKHLLEKNRNTIKNVTRNNKISDFLNEIIEDNTLVTHMNKSLNYQSEKSFNNFNHNNIENMGQSTSSKGKTYSNDYVPHNLIKTTPTGEVLPLHNRHPNPDIQNNNLINTISVENSLTNHRYTQRNILSNDDVSDNINNELVSHYGASYSTYVVKHNPEREVVTENIQKIKSLLKTSISKEGDLSIDDIALSADICETSKSNSFNSQLEEYAKADTFEVNYSSVSIDVPAKEHKSTINQDVFETSAVNISDNEPEEKNSEDISNKLNDISDVDEEILFQPVNNKYMINQDVNETSAHNNSDKISEEKAVEYMPNELNEISDVDEEILFQPVNNKYMINQDVNETSALNSSENVPEEKASEYIPNELNEISDVDDEKSTESLNKKELKIKDDLAQLSKTESAENWNIASTQHNEHLIKSVRTNSSPTTEGGTSTEPEDILNIFQFYERFGSDFLMGDNAFAATNESDIYKEDEEWWDSGDMLARKSLEASFVSATSAALFFTLPPGFNCSHVTLLVKEISWEPGGLGSERPCRQLPVPEDFLFFVGGLRQRTTYRVLVYEAPAGRQGTSVRLPRGGRPWQMEDGALLEEAEIADEESDASLLLSFTQSTCFVTPPRPKTVWDAGGGPGWVEGRARLPFARASAGVGSSGNSDGENPACTSAPRALLGLRLRPVASPRPRGFPRYLDLGHIALASARSGKGAPTGSRAFVVARPDHPCAVAHTQPDLFCILIMSGVQEDEVYSFAVSTIRLLEEEDELEDNDKRGEEKDLRYNRLNWEKNIKQMPYNIESHSDSRAEHTFLKERDQQTDYMVIGERGKEFQGRAENRNRITQHKEVKNIKMYTKRKTEENVFEGIKSVSNENSSQYHNRMNASTNQPYKKEGCNKLFDIDGQVATARTNKHQETSVFEENTGDRGDVMTRSIENRKTVEREGITTNYGKEDTSRRQRRWVRGLRTESAPVFVALRAQQCDPVARGSCNTPGEAPTPPWSDTSAGEDSQTQKSEECPGAAGDDALAAALLALTVAVLAVGAPLAYVLGKRAGGREDKLRWIHRGNKNIILGLDPTDDAAAAAAAAAAATNATTDIVRSGVLAAPAHPSQNETKREKKEKRLPVRFMSPVIAPPPRHRNTSSSSEYTQPSPPPPTPPPAPPTLPPPSPRPPSVAGKLPHSHPKKRHSPHRHRKHTSGHTKISDKSRY